MRMWRWNQWKKKQPVLCLGTLSRSEVKAITRDAFPLSGLKKRIPARAERCFVIVFTLLTGMAILNPVSSIADQTGMNGTAQKHLTLEEIIVTGDAITNPMGTKVDIKKIEKGKNINIPDVLKFEPDIDLKRRTLIGDTTDSLAIRGFTSNRVILTINGRPVNASGVVGGYYIDWSTIPLDNIEKIELIRGGSSVRYGNNALGGVVNVITKRPTEKPTLTFFGTYGGGNDIDFIHNYRLTHTFRIGPLGYSLAGSFQKADPFLWNNDFEGKNMAASINLDMPLHGQLTFGFQYADSERGFIRENRFSPDPGDPGFYEKKDNDYPLAFGETFSPYSGSAFLSGPGANWNKTKYYLDLGYSQPIRDALLELKVYKNYEDREEENYSSGDINRAYTDGQLVLDRDVESDRSYGGGLELTKPYGDHELLIGVEHKTLAYGNTTTNYVDLIYNNAPWVSIGDLTFEPSSEGICWGYYIRDTWMISDRLMLTGGLRFDEYRNKSINGSTSPELEDHALIPKLTGTYRITREDTVTASAYQALRTPGLPETYWWAEGATGGKPILKPEKNNAFELLYQHELNGSGFIRLSAYYYNVDDYIIFRFNPSWRGVYNMDEARIYGASLDSRATLTDWLSGSASLTFQQSKKEGDIYDTAGLSNEIDYLPDWKASGRLKLTLPYRSVLDITLRYVGEREAIYAYSSGWPAQQYFRRVELDPYITTDINLKVQVGKHAEFSCYMENLFDEEYEEQFGYPMPGLIIGAAFKLSS
jgi:outer membrane receptor protein involved in Fe transport